MSSFRRLEVPSQNFPQTVKNIIRDFSDGESFVPAYQRAACWKLNQNCGLIMSIMRNEVVPGLVFYMLHPSNPDDAAAYAAGHRYECVDGQNRLRAMASFRSGVPLVNDKGKNDEVVWLGRSGHEHMSYALLSAEERGWFDNYSMPVTIIQSSMTLEERKAQFTRLQDGSKITRSEYLKNTEHPVSQYVSRAGLRDKFLPVGKGLMAGVTQWMDVFTDCVTLWIHRDAEVPLDCLVRSQTDLRKVLKGEKKVGRGDPCYMPFTEEDDVAVTPLFDALFSALEAAKTEKVKCHKFHITLLFLHLLRGGAVPAPAILRFWFKETFKGIAADTKAEVADADIRAGLLEALQASLDRGDIEPPVKKKRAGIPKYIRLELWADYFGEEERGMCQCCGKRELRKDGSWHQAHIIAAAMGGLDIIDNLVPTCAICNRGCSVTDLREYCMRKHPDAPFLARLTAAAGIQ